jgi:hypothetical protein
LEPSKTKCDDNELFCMQQAKCVAILGGCEGEQTTPTPVSETHTKCGTDEFFCLEQARCVAVLGGCEDGGVTSMSTPSTETYRKCGGNEYFCLERNECVSKAGLCDDRDRSCGVGEVYCETVDRCISGGPEMCDSRAGTTTHKCGQEELFCLQQNECMPKRVDCRTKPATTTAAPFNGSSCTDGQVGILQWCF